MTTAPVLNGEPRVWEPTGNRRALQPRPLTSQVHCMGIPLLVNNLRNGTSGAQVPDGPSALAGTAQRCDSVPRCVGCSAVRFEERDPGKPGPAVLCDALRVRSVVVGTNRPAGTL